MNIATQAAVFFLGEDIVKVQPLNAGTANISFLVQDHNGNEYVLRRRSPKYANSVFAAYETEYLTYLAAGGLPVPMHMTAPDGSLFCHLDSTLWQISQLIKGSPFSGSLMQIREAGYFLARMHNAAAGFIPIHEREHMRYEHPDLLLTQYELFLRSCPPSSCCCKRFGWVERLIERLMKTLPDDIYCKLPQEHIHGDYHSSNLLFLNDAVSGVFDFDRSSLQARLRDVADGVIFFGSIRKSSIDDRNIISLTQGFRPDHTLSRIFLQSYQDGLIVPQTSDEIKLLPDFIAARFLGMRLDGMAKLPEQKRRFMLDRDIEEPLGWLDTKGLNIHI